MQKIPTHLHKLSLKQESNRTHTHKKTQENEAETNKRNRNVDQVRQGGGGRRGGGFRGQGRMGCRTRPLPFRVYDTNPNLSAR